MPVLGWVRVEGGTLEGGGAAKESAPLSSNKPPLPLPRPPLFDPLWLSIPRIKLPLYPFMQSLLLFLCPRALI